MLKGTPYLLDEVNARRVLDTAGKIDHEVKLLRKGGTLDATTLERLRQEWGIRQVHESAAIEGNQLTLNETAIAIQRGITISGKPPEHSAEVQHLNRALEYVDELAKSASPISEREIRELQALVIGPDVPDRGAYRTVEVQITNSPHRPPHPVKVPDQMAQFGKWLSESQNCPVPLRATICHAWLAHIHPFSDGNGRTARAVMNLMFIREGYPIVIIRRKDRQRYYEALRASDDGDITPLLELIVDRCHDSLRQIDRVRSAATGISLALERVREKEELRYRLWADGIRLLGTTLESMLKDVEARDGDFRVTFQHYDLPTVEDYRDICAGSPAGNTWFLKCRIERRGKDHSFLLWIGYSTEELRRELRLAGAIPSVKISVRNDSPPPAWILADEGFPSPTREFAYNDGRFYRLEQRGHTVTLVTAESAVTLIGEFVAEVIEGWFS